MFSNEIMEKDVPRVTTLYRLRQNFKLLLLLGNIDNRSIDRITKLLLLHFVPFLLVHLLHRLSTNCSKHSCLVRRLSPLVKFRKNCRGTPWSAYSSRFILRVGSMFEEISHRTERLEMYSYSHIRDIMFASDRDRDQGI